ncbi:Molybdenum cofactor guanylyltransferase [Pseudomonas sp. MM227]|uniref:molybdenum cofactor guanylyltransferase MobA n=1 Tax=Pseudomonas sp. MM227 TaxID=3019968 RepID=UPI000F0130DF|nr:molybdenum cofactor guanylyltransferase MobA [Pseudomonas sp. MM227]CAI3787885.1 Molybdenum cofactor guanylyltransferase [Pseudomonas sp. MM227]
MNPADTLPPCSVLLLAGGRGQRMGGRDKGLIDWHGRPLIEHLQQRVRPVTDDLIISCNRNYPRYAAFADRLVHDDSSDFPGPLAGILAGLAAARHPLLLVLPCDVPGVDEALLDAMRHAQQTHPTQPLMVRQGEFWEPLLCIVGKVHQPLVRQAWDAGERSPRKVLLALNAQPLQCAENDPRLANFNTPQLLGR